MARGFGAYQQSTAPTRTRQTPKYVSRNWNYRTVKTIGLTLSKSSRKGDRREHEWAHVVGGEKLSRKGYEGPDVKSDPLELRKVFEYWEVKSTEDLPLWLVGDEGWIGQMHREGADAVVFRQNRKQWYLLTPITAGELSRHRPR